MSPTPLLAIESKLDLVRTDAWDRALHCFGTAYIFERRARGPKFGLRALTFTGLVLPLVVGGYVMIFGRAAPQLETALVIVGVLATAQAAVSLWALVAKWDDQYASALESIVDNYRLSGRFKSIGRNPPADAEALFNLLLTENAAREAADIRQLMSDKEKRMGMHAALREFQRACVSCKTIPVSMKSSECGVCGNY